MKIECSENCALFSLFIGSYKINSKPAATNAGYCVVNQLKLCKHFSQFIFSIFNVGRKTRGQAWRASGEGERWNGACLPWHVVGKKIQ